MKLTIEESKAFLEARLARHLEKRAETLAEAKVEAAGRGKEPFDLAKLETLCDTSHEGSTPPSEERIKEYEWKYYVSHRTTMTLREFEAEVSELSRW